MNKLYFHGILLCTCNTFHMGKLSSKRMLYASRAVRNFHQSTALKDPLDNTNNNDLTILVDKQELLISRDAVKERINSEGYSILKIPQNGNGTSVLSSWVKKNCSLKHSGIIFNNLGPGNTDVKVIDTVSVGDEKRLIYYFDEEKKPKSFNDIDCMMKTLYPSLYPSSPAVIISKANCQRQARHLDWSGMNSALVSVGCIQDAPVSVLIAIQEESTIDIWPKSHLVIQKYMKLKAKNKSKETIRQWAAGISKIHAIQESIPKGFMVVFRQDVVHAGSAYRRANKRIFQYYNLYKNGNTGSGINYVHLHDEINDIFV